MFDSWIHGTVPRTIGNAFREAGLVPYEESGVICFRIDHTAAKKVCHWREAPMPKKGWAQQRKGESVWSRNRAQILTSEHAFNNMNRRDPMLTFFRFKCQMSVQMSYAT
jgi:hypothetical protein